MPALLRRPACPGARPCQGRSSLDRTCAPAEHGSYREARTGKISQIEVSTLSGEPRDTSERRLPHALLLRRLRHVHAAAGTLGVTAPTGVWPPPAHVTDGDGRQEVVRDIRLI